MPFKLRSKAVVQTLATDAAKCSGTLCGLCGENCIPDAWRGFAIDAKLSEFELTFPDPMHEFNARDGDRGAPKALQSKHWTQTKFDRSMPQAGGKIVRKGLDFFWEKSVTGFTVGSAKRSPGIPPRRLQRLCGASVVAVQKAASTHQGIPTMSLKKLPSNNPRRTDLKEAQVLAMLHSKQGATIATIRLCHVAKYSA